MATAPASQDTDLSFPTKGSLKRVPFPRILREVARFEVTGSLYLLSGQTKKVVFFEEGLPVFVRSNVLSECLGQILAHEGLITQEQCEQTLEAIRRTGKKQGELLVEMGILSEGNLRYGLEAQLRAKLFDIFSWEDGRYQFKHDPPNLSFGIKLDTTPEGVIIEGIQSQFAEERAALALEAHHGKYPTLRRDEADLDRLGLLPEERYAVDRLDGSRLTEDIVAGPHDPPLPSPAALLWGLLQAGLVQLSSRALPARAEPAAPELGPGQWSDDDLHPGYPPQNEITEYEDTPLPGELPKSPDLLGDHEDDFAGVGEEDSGPLQVSVAKEIPQELVADQPAAAVDETFDDDAIELIDDDDMVEVVEDDLDIGSLDLDVDIDVAEPALLHDAEPEPEPVPVLDLEPSSLPGPIPAAAAAAAAAEPVEAPVLEDEPPVDLALEKALLSAPSEPAPIEPPLLDAGPTAIDGPANDAGFDADDELSLAPDDELSIDPVSFDADDDLSLDGDLAIDDDLADIDDDLDSIDLPGVDDLEPEGSSFDGMSLEVDDDLADFDDLDGVHLGAQAQPAAPVSPRGADDDALVDFDDLDAIDLGGPAPVSDLAADAVSIDPHSIDPVSIEAVPLDDEEDNPEVVGAMKFNEAETALAEDRYSEAIDALEQAYENGFDVAELHAMLAYARFMEGGQSVEAADHSLELLDYAQNMDPSLDLVHAYRGAIYRAINQPDRAREALDRALELNPYCELAMEIMDSL